MLIVCEYWSEILISIFVGIGLASSDKYIAVNATSGKSKKGKKKKKRRKGEESEEEDIPPIHQVSNVEEMPEVCSPFITESNICQSEL